MAPQKKTESLKSQLESLGKAIDQDFLGILNRELDELSKISEFTGSVQKRLQQLYGDYFPKRCPTCETMYKTKEDFFKKTKLLRNKSVIVDKFGVQEYRNCSCGSTLLLWTEDRRDMSEFGAARRKLFDDCMDKLKKISTLPQEQLKEKLRSVLSLIDAHE